MLATMKLSLSERSPEKRHITDRVVLEERMCDLDFVARKRVE